MVSSLLDLPMIPFVITAFGLTIIQWILSSTSRFSLLRVIPCPQITVGTAHLVISTILRTLIMVSLTIAYVSIHFDVREYGTFTHALLLYRALNKLYHCPLTASIESMILIYGESLWLVMLASFLLDRAIILYRKSTYVLVSVLTAIKNKK